MIHVIGTDTGDQGKMYYKNWVEGGWKFNQKKSIQKSNLFNYKP